MVQATEAMSVASMLLPAAMQPDTLFARGRAYTTTEVRNAHADVARVFYRHSLTRFHAGDELHFCHRGANLRRTSFNYISYGADVSVGVDYVDRDRYVIVAPLSGSAQVSYGGRATPIARGQFIILDPMHTFRWEMSADHSHLAVGIPAQMVREGQAQLGPRRLGSLSEGPLFITEPAAVFFEYVSYLCGELDRARSFVSAPQVADTLEISLTNMLLAAIQPRNDGVDDLEERAVAPACVARAESFMRERLTEEITATDIIAAAGVPMRTLYRAFDRYRAVSPKQWLQRERLERARAELLAARPRKGTTVTDVATRYCATNVGRFSRSYAAQFGEPPSETLCRALARSK